MINFDDLNEVQQQYLWSIAHGRHNPFLHQGSIDSLLNKGLIEQVASYFESERGYDNFRYVLTELGRSVIAQMQPDTGNPPTLAALLASIRDSIDYGAGYVNDYGADEGRINSGREALEQVAALVHDHELAERDLGKLRTDYGVLVEFVEELAAHKYEFALDKIAEEARALLASLQEAEK